MVAGALTPSAGRILFDGEDITGLPTHRLFHRGIVRTFQIPHEFGGLTVLENLMAVPAAQPGERLWPVWLAPGAVARREREVRERGGGRAPLPHSVGSARRARDELSGGQKKLLELGRAMMTSPRLVLLDEPGAGVNPTLLVRLREMILELNRERGYTFVVIEHDMDFIASLCERVIVLSQGAVLTDGPMEQVRRDPRVLDAYLGGDEDEGRAGPEPRGGRGKRARHRRGGSGWGRRRSVSDACAGTPQEGAGTPVLALERVTGGYGGAEIIHEVSVTVGPGEIVVLVGPNGAGKSTVMNAVLGRLELAGGRVSLRGRDITGTAPDRVVRQGVCYVPQTATCSPTSA